MEIAPNVHQLASSFVNLYMIVEPNGLTLIDAGVKSSPKLVLKTLAALGKQPSDVKRILITHADPDHYGGAPELKQKTGARIYGSAQEATAMARGTSSREFRAPALVRWMFSLTNKLMPMSPTKVDEVLVPGETLPILGGLRVLSTPGHTPDHVSFYAPSLRLLVAGDSLNTGGGKIKFIDGPVTWDYQRGLQSLREQAALKPEVVVAGHGPALRGAQVVFPV